MNKQIQTLQRPEDLMTLSELPEAFIWDDSTWVHGSCSMESMATMLGLSGPEKMYPPSIEWMATARDGAGNFTRRECIQMVFRVDGLTIYPAKVEVLKY